MQELATQSEEQVSLTTYLTTGLATSTLTSGFYHPHEALGSGTEGGWVCENQQGEEEQYGRNLHLQGGGCYGSFLEMVRFISSVPIYCGCNAGGRMRLLYRI